MHDFHLIDNDPKAFEAALLRRGVVVDADEIVTVHRRLQATRTEVQALLARRNEISTRMAEIKREDQAAVAPWDPESGAEPPVTEEQALTAETRAMKPEITRLERLEQADYDRRDQLVGALPNLPASDVPDGAEAVEIAVRGDRRPMVEPKDHVALAGDYYDSATAGAISGSRYAILKGPVAELERALGQFMISMHTQLHGYTEMSVPFIVSKKAMFGTGQLPKFEDDLFKLTDGNYLIPTGEVPLTNLVRENTTEREALPLRYTALTPCFRSEAGASGRDTVGLIRQHQFMKVELVTLCEPQNADEEFERTVVCAERVLKALGLPYRVMMLAAEDLGFSARKTVDLEVWMPGQGRYVEIASISDCGTFQTQRMKGRYRQEDGKLGYLNSINGSGLAVGRTLAAVLENYQTPMAGLSIPRALLPFMRPQLPEHLERMVG